MKIEKEIFTFSTFESAKIPLSKFNFTFKNYTLKQHLKQPCKNYINELSFHSQINFHPQFRAPLSETLGAIFVLNANPFHPSRDRIIPSTFHASTLRATWILPSRYPSRFPSDILSRVSFLLRLDPGQVVRNPKDPWCERSRLNQPGFTCTPCLANEPATR